ncbi:MAG: hypothetical protein HYR60_15510 [Acidobacteria bacterium]|nr:hypothetical protein [Acidobacteriota bacterium]MBI3472681.1 hypothetical protein [Candidatus Solibacter usitatus]
MASIPHSASLTQTAAAARVRVDSIPWYVWCCVAAVTSAIIGVQWDISWHRSIGRDTFWTPAHIAIYMCGVLAGISCGYLILHTTFSRSSPLRESSVTMWGFRGPLGAFIAAWGGVAMLVSAPFDDWWHNAYGLDVKIISPPHTLLFIGNAAIQMGGIILILGAMNRGQGEFRRRMNWVFLYAGAMLLSLVGIFIMAYTFAVNMHNALFYRVVCTAVPAALVGLGRASHMRWGATRVAALFMLLWAAMIWVLPLFPAEPKLGPVYQKVTHFIPPPFPILILAPAFFLDLLFEKIARRDRWLQSLAGGAVFLGAYWAAQWPFASFLLSPAARNAIFGMLYFDYGTRPESAVVRQVFTQWEKTPVEFWGEMAVALAMAILMTRLGLAWGDSMRRVRR